MIYIMIQNSTLPSNLFSLSLSLSLSFSSIFRSLLSCFFLDTTYYPGSICFLDKYYQLHIHDSRFYVLPPTLHLAPPTSPPNGTFQRQKLTDANETSSINLLFFKTFSKRYTNKQSKRRFPLL